jgi:hypothetical protein
MIFGKNGRREKYLMRINPSYHSEDLEKLPQPQELFKEIHTLMKKNFEGVVVDTISSKYEISRYIVIILITCWKSFLKSMKINRKNEHFILKSTLFDYKCVYFNINLMLIKSFPFLDDRTFLVAQMIGEEKIKRLLFIRFETPELKKVRYLDSIDCIHTALATTTYDELTRNTESATEVFKNAEKKYITSEGQRKEIHLEASEDFKMHCSYVAGIAEAGLGAFHLATEIGELIKGHSFIIGKSLFKFILLSLDSVEEQCEKIAEYMEHCYKVCRFENELHKASFLANVKFIKSVALSLPYSEKIVNFLTDLFKDYNLELLE